jgi:hypothetical protein
LLLTGLYLVDYHRVENHPAPASIADALRASLQLLSLLFGASAPEIWPASAIAALVLVAGSAAVLARTAMLGPRAERPRALGLLCVLAALGTLVLALGWGRAGSGERAGFEPRYVTLVAPLGCAVVFVWDLYGGPVLRRLVPTCLCAALLVLLWPDTRAALDHGRFLARQAREFALAVREGMPIYLLVKRFPVLHPSQDELAAELHALRRAGIGIFAALREDPPLRLVPVPVLPADVLMARWDAGTGTAHIDGIDPYVHFVLPEALPVAGIRIAYTHANRVGGPARFALLWTSDDRAERNAGQRYANWALPTGRDRTTTVWVGDTVKQFWIQPDNQPCEFTIAGLDLLIPSAGPGRGPGP